MLTFFLVAFAHLAASLTPRLLGLCRAFLFVVIVEQLLLAQLPQLVSHLERESRILGRLIVEYGGELAAFGPLDRLLDALHLIARELDAQKVFGQVADDYLVELGDELGLAHDAIDAGKVSADLIHTAQLGACATTTTTTTTTTYSVLK